MERVRKGSGDGGWVGGCGTLGRPRDSELGQDAERVGAVPPWFLRNTRRTGEVEEANEDDKEENNTQRLVLFSVLKTATTRS